MSTSRERIADAKTLLCHMANNRPCLAGAGENHLSAIAKLVAHKAEIDRAITANVILARHEGTPYWMRRWADIGNALGTSSQAANQKYGGLV